MGVHITKADDDGLLCQRIRLDGLVCNGGGRAAGRTRAAGNGWGIVLAALLLTVGCALADDSGFGLDNERAQAIYWEYSGAVIEDYAEVETAGRSFAFILFKQEQMICTQFSGHRFKIE